MTLEWMSFTVLHTYYLAIVYFRNVADKNNDKWLILVMLEGEGLDTSNMFSGRGVDSLTCKIDYG